MLIDIRIKFHKDILNDFQVIEWTRFCDGQRSGPKEIIKKVYMQELSFLQPRVV